jgi:hypothetical protein
VAIYLARSNIDRLFDARIAELLARCRLCVWNKLKRNLGSRALAARAR